MHLLTKPVVDSTQVLHGLMAALPTLVELIPVDDEAGGQVMYNRVVVKDISFSVFLTTSKLAIGRMC